MTTTRYVYVTQNNADISTGDFELDLWNDFKMAMGCSPRSHHQSIEDAQKTREKVKKEHPNIPEGKIMKITIEAVDEAPSMARASDM